MSLPGLLAAAALLLPGQRQVAVTFDDLPLASATPLDVAARESVTARLLSAVVKHRVPAIGFVNEGKLADSAGRLRPEMVALLERWLDDGLELGNHTYAHPDLHTTPLPEFEADVMRGDSVTRRLLAVRGQMPRYFRHPYLHTGRSLPVRDSLVAFLGRHGYRVAPVTIDNADYVFARAFDQAKYRGDSVGAARLATAFLIYMDTVVGFWEAQSRAIVGREIPQILLLHASQLNSETFDQLASALERRGYRMISLDQALADSVYRRADTFTGPGGISWLHRWAITAGVSPGVFGGEPVVPGWVAGAAR
jgi:peptidoglycan/xylan/chitin deacetylase (PgdA/CDA1 family)